MTDKQVDIQQLLDEGIRFHRAGEAAKAGASYRRILHLQPDHVNALNNMGALLQEQGKCAEAIAHYKQALSINPDYVCCYYNLGNAYRADGRLEDAVAAYEKAVALNPVYADAYNNMGLCLHDMRRLKDAIAVYHQAVKLRPDCAEIQNNLGNALQQQGLLNEAVTCLNSALSMKKNYTDARNNLGVALQKQGKIKEAIAEYTQALAIRPDYPDAHCNRGHALLLSGDMKNGFAEYEWRWRVKGINYEKPRVLPKPLWDGSDLTGKSILLHAEQGYGDTIHFFRYALMLAEKGARVIVECQPALAGLLSIQPGIHQVIPRGAAIPEFDFHAPLLSLPHLCGTTLKSMPVSIPYIIPPLFYNLRIDEPGGKNLKVGIVWAGSRTHDNDKNRSCDIALFRQLMDVPGIAWYSLQKGGPEKEIAALGDSRKYLKDAGGSINDFADTASVINQMDLIVTVDTAVAHLAGAMGKPLWVLLPFVPDWRWMMERADSPWYPTMRLFRQTKPGDWNGVFEKVRHELQNKVKKEAQPNIAINVSENSVASEKSENAAASHDLIKKANEHLAAGRLREAESLCRKLLSQKQSIAGASYILGTILKRRNQHDKAIDMLRQAIRYDSSSINYLFDLADLLHHTGRLEEALAYYDESLKLRPDLAPIHNNKGNILKLLGNFEGAAACYEQAARLNPDLPEIHTNMGVALAGQLKLEEAKRCYKKALVLKADHASTHWNLSLLLLLMGNYEAGWREYEWRSRVPTYANFYAANRKPRWQGEDIAGRTILLHSEQGLGDTLQFIRYAPLVAERGGRVIVRCQPELVKLLRGGGNFGEITGLNEPVPAHDIQCPLMSLPFVFGTTLSSIPAQTPYIIPEKELIAKWRKKISRKRGIKTGLVWAGKLWDTIPAVKSIDRRRSISLKMMAKLGGISGVTFYSLQMGDAANQIKTQSDLSVVDLTPDIGDFCDTAALIANLDMVITVDTSVAHLAGAMGKTVWILSRFDGCWRWLLNRDDSPWYPSARLFRQTSPGNWDEVINRVAAELGRL